MLLWLRICYRTLKAKYNFNRKSIGFDSGGLGSGTFKYMLENPKLKRCIVALDNASRPTEHKSDGSKTKLLKEYMAYIMTTEVEIQQQSGDNISTAFDTTMMTASNLRAESIINCVGRFNFSDTFSGLNVDVKQILSDFCSKFVAIEALNFKPSGQDGALSRIEYEDRINVLRDGMLRSMMIIRDQKVVTFINAAT